MSYLKKNRMYIDVDPERERKLIIGKPKEYDHPTNVQENKDMLLNDVNTLCEALCLLMHVLDEADIQKTPVTLRHCINSLETGFSDAEYKTEDIRKTTAANA